MVKILFLHTTGEWWESRYHYKQIMALRAKGYKVTHVFRAQDVNGNIDTDIVQIQENQLKWVRATGGINLFIQILKFKHNVVQICSLELLPLGILLAIFTRKKIFYDCIEDHFNSMVHSKVYFPKILRKLLGLGVKLIEGLASITFTGFVTSDPFIFNRHKYMPADKKMLFYNMPPLRSFKNYLETDSSKKFDLAILGSMSIRTGVLDVLKAISILKSEGISVSIKFVGNPYADKLLEKEMKHIIIENNLECQISITGKIPFDKVPQQLIDCRIGVIPLLNLPKFQNNIAMKQWEYMALGMPVISSLLPPQKLFIKDNFNGLFYDPGNIMALKDKIKYLLEHPEEIDRMGTNGKIKVFEEWNSENQEKKYIEFYELRLNGLPYTESQLPPIRF